MVSEHIEDRENSDNSASSAIDWKALREEFSVEKLWTSQKLGNIFSNFLKVLLIGLIPSFFDLYTDSSNAKTFIIGNHYIKHITNMSDFNNDSCRHIGTSGDTL